MEGNYGISDMNLTETKAISALKEISNQETQYKFRDWTNNNSSNKGKQSQRYSYQVLRLKKLCHVDRETSIKKIQSSFKLPSLEHKIIHKINVSNQNVQMPQIENRQNQMNSVFGFVKHRNKKKMKNHHSSNLPCFQSLDQQKTLAELMPSVWLDQKEEDKRIQLIKSWLKQKRLQSKTLNKLLNKYCIKDKSKRNLLLQSLDSDGNQLSEDTGFKIKSLFWNN